jgi:hypothetical protein
MTSPPRAVARRRLRELVTERRICARRLVRSRPVAAEVLSAAGDWLASTSARAIDEDAMRGWSRPQRSGRRWCRVRGTSPARSYALDAGAEAIADGRHRRGAPRSRPRHPPVQESGLPTRHDGCSTRPAVEQTIAVTSITLLDGRPRDPDARRAGAFVFQTDLAICTRRERYEVDATLQRSGSSRAR